MLPISSYFFLVLGRSWKLRNIHQGTQILVSKDGFKGEVVPFFNVLQQSPVQDFFDAGHEANVLTK